MTDSGSVRSDVAPPSSSPSDPTPSRPFPARATTAVALGLVFLACHLPSLAPVLEDIDSINFALGLHDYDPTNNRPHPPGYPVYIALGRASLWLIHALSIGVDAIQQDALALSVMAAAGGALAVMASWWVARAIMPGASVAPWASSALLAACPLFWLTGVRPMSDMPGLAAAMVTQALTLRGLEHRSYLVAAAACAGAAAGLRSQTVWLTVPLLAWALWVHRRAGLVWLLTRPVAAGAISGFAWAVPMVMAAGGLGRYLQALGGQAGDDFAGVDMLYRDLTVRHVARALRDSLVLPWGEPVLANVVLVLALVGAAAMLVRERRGLALLVLAFAPYALFHLMLQETLTVRYALPIMPAVTLLAAFAVSLAGRAAPALALGVVAGALAVSVPVGIEYGRSPHPAMVAVRAMVEESRRERPERLFAHHALGQPLEIESAAPLPVVIPQLREEWLGPVEYWRGGGMGPIWFLADPRRTDLALIDPQARRNVTRYRWPLDTRPELGGTRPLGADWYRLSDPGWFVGTGWSLTLEAGGVTAASGNGPDRRPIEAYVRRRSEPAWVMVGGRDLNASQQPTLFDLSVDGRLVDTWRLDPAAGQNFLRVVPLPQGVPNGPGRFATLTIAARAEAAGVPTPAVAIRQFNVQSADTMMVGFGEGWHEEEFDTGARRGFRWTSDRSVLQVVPAQAIDIVVRGESPLRYFDSPPTVRVTAGGREIARTSPDGDFEWRVRVPADDVSRAGGAVALEVDRAYVPAEREGTADMRRLGLRLHSIDVTPVLP